ncbi:unnamed protein product [Schistosoma bovis]|nr:unnamed protein product [Schistosoma bovis]
MRLYIAFSLCEVFRAIASGGIIEQLTERSFLIPCVEYTNTTASYIENDCPFDFEEEYDELNAQLDALSKCLDILEAKGKKVCDEAKRLVIEYRSQNYETSS